MRRILIGSAAAVLAMSAMEAPAMAQYGGSPEEQVEGPEAGEEDDAVNPDDEADLNEAADMVDDGPLDAEAYPDGDAALEPDEQAAIEDAGPAAEEAETNQGDTWQGEDGRSYCRRSDGTTGLIVGGGAGALVGRGIDRRGERGTGTIIGAIAGALVGSAIERGANEQRCR
jgi:hypothetical protein